MKEFTFQMYKLDIQVKVITLFAFDENEAWHKADKLLKQNPHKYDDWKDVTPLQY